MADVVFGQHPDPTGEAATEGQADHLLGFSVPVAGGDIDQRDPALDGSADGGHGLVTVGRPPHLADPTPTDGEDTDRPQRAQHPGLHAALLYMRTLWSDRI